MSVQKSVLEPVIREIFDGDDEYRAFGTVSADVELPDFIFASGIDEHDPKAIFPRIRWGGQFVYADPSLAKVQDAARTFAEYGFALEKPADTVLDGWRLWPFIRNKVHYFAARKILHVPKGGLTDRFTFEVELSECHEVDHGKHVVTKRIPSVEWVVNRLHDRNSKMDLAELERRAQGLIQNILPIFLTREVAIMNRLQERLPADLRNRVPHTVRYEQDERGYVKLLQVNWLRNGGKPISQLDFAIQSAELLHAVHARAGVAHLDLRLDNMVITPEGVGFIDFGNSVHDDEDIAASPTLQRIFHDLMRSCTVQRTLHRAVQAGQVTAPYFIDAVFKVDKAVDLFYLVRQFTSPHENPDLKDFIDYQSSSKEDYELHKMTRRLFAPEDLEPGKVYTAAHVVNALRTIKRRLG
jgi:hypothetical protein